MAHQIASFEHLRTCLVKAEFAPKKSLFFEVIEFIFNGGLLKDFTQHVGSQFFVQFFAHICRQAFYYF